MSFHPSEQLVAAGGAFGGAVIDVEQISVRSWLKNHLSGPLRFDPTGGGLWYFSRKRGLVLRDDGGKETRAWKDDQIFSGDLTFTAGGEMMVYSKAREVYSVDRGSSTVGSSDTPVIRLDDANAVSLAVDRTGRWIAVNWGIENLTKLYHRDDRGAWVEADLPSVTRSCINRFSHDGRDLISLSGALVGRRAMTSTGRVEWFQLPGSSESSRGDLPRRLVPATMADAVVVDLGNGAPLLLDFEGGAPRSIAELERGTGAARSSIAVAADGGLAASASSCWRGSVVTIWDLRALRSSLDEAGFEPVELEPVQFGN